jgi:poly-gamma-glutamate synthesis protein (capsule biosynthesis protein)
VQLVDATASSATLQFAGDTALVDAGLPVYEREGFDYAFSATADRLRDADLAVVNLEAPNSDRGAPIARLKEYLYRSPPAAAEALARAGVDLVGLANNHSMDFGADALADTIARLDRVKVTPVGAGVDEAAARRGVVVRVGRLRVGLLARCERQLDWDLYIDQFAGPDHAGVAALDEGDLEEDIAALRLRADVVVVMAHWGRNYAPPTDAAIAWGRRAARAGADLVIGHHPHEVHPIALEGRTPIALSLGNYAFGTTGHPTRTGGALLLARVEGRRIARIELVPLDVQNARVGFRLAGRGGGLRPARRRAASTSCASATGLSAWRPFTTKAYGPSSFAPRIASRSCSIAGWNRFSSSAARRSARSRPTDWAICSICSRSGWRPPGDRASWNSQNLPWLWA